MKQIKVLMVFFVLFIGGCGSSSSTSNETLSLDEENIVRSVTDNVSLDEQFVDGKIVEETKIPIKDGSEILSTVIIPVDTEFTDENGNLVEAAPHLTVTQQESSTTTEEEDENNASNNIQRTANIVKGEYKFISDGTKVIPSKAIKITIAAPKGSRPGDRVRVDVPDNVEKAPGQEKLTIYIVDRNGNITVLVFPQVFEDWDVVVIIVERVIVGIDIQPLDDGTADDGTTDDGTTDDGTTDDGTTDDGTTDDGTTDDGTTDDGTTDDGTTDDGTTGGGTTGGGTTGGGTTGASGGTS